MENQLQMNNNVLPKTSNGGQNIAAWMFLLVGLFAEVLSKLTLQTPTTNFIFVCIESVAWAFLVVTASNKATKIAAILIAVSNITMDEVVEYAHKLGERIGNEFGCSVVEAHHIEYFTKSLNNDTSNIIIVNPSFHRIIHQTSPIFDRKTLSFVFPNGVIEKVKLDKHLNCK